MNTIIFFRDDDVGEKNGTIIRLIELCEKYDMPLSLEIIPKNLEEEFVHYFNSLSKKYLFDVGQHGYDHLPVDRNGINEGEFGKSKSMEEKRKSLELGWDIIEKNFTSQKMKIFTPPWGALDKETYELLKDLKYDAISALGRARDKNPLINIVSFLNDPLYFNKQGMIDISISINNMRDFVKKIPSTGRELIADVERFSEKTKYVGVMLHDKIMDDKAFVALEELFRHIKEQKRTVKTMSQIVHDRKNNG